MANVPQRSFASGELAPAMYARTDVTKYASGLRTCRNFIIQATGGANWRPGFDFIADLSAAGDTIRLLPFIFNNEQAYVLAFGERVVRVYQRGVLVTTVPTVYPADAVSTLNFAQSADILTLVHLNYRPYELRRVSASSWTFTAVTFGPSIAAPASLTVTPAVPGPGRCNRYFITAVNGTTGEESLVTRGSAVSAHTPSEAQPDGLTWPAVTEATEYRIYQTIDDPPSTLPLEGEATAAGWIATVTDTAFSNPGIVPDFTQNPPIAFTGFASTNDYPSVTGFYQQRQLYANTNNDPEKVWASQVGNFRNMNARIPLTDDQPVSFIMASATVSEVRHLLDLGKLVIGTEGAEWLIEGDANGVLSPNAINARTGSYNGCSQLTPVKVGNSVLYVQGLGNKILELKTNIYQGYYTFTGKDMTVFSSHLFNGYTIVDWDYAQIPNYLTWAVRSDGTLLGFTYLDEQQLMAWHRHDTLGSFENVCVIPEDGEHRLYVTVTRIINGTTKRYLERMRPMALLSIDDACFLDAALEYDGRDVGTASNTLTLTGSGWEPFDLLTLTASNATEFSTARVGDARLLRNAAGDQVVATITVITSPTVATVYPDIAVPTNMQAVAITDWDRAVMTVGNLGHLEGEAVGVFADQLVVASPNNPAVTEIVVSGGEAVLDQAYAHIVVGLPYLGDLETLDIDTPQGPSLKESNIAVTRAGLWVQASRGIFAGTEAPTGTDATEGLMEFKVRSDTQTPGDPNPLLTQYIKQDISGSWNDNGRVLIRQVDPVPCNILAVIPLGYLPESN